VLRLKKCGKVHAQTEEVWEGCYMLSLKKCWNVLRLKKCGKVRAQTEEVWEGWYMLRLKSIGTRSD